MRNIEKEIEEALGRVEETDGSDLIRLKELAYLIEGVRPIQTSLAEYNSYWVEFRALRKKVLNE